MRSSLSIVVVALLTLVACGPSGPRRADVTPGTMPSNATFTGVYFSPEYGRMDLIQTGSSVLGEYTKDERRGRIEGTARGDLLRFQWTERRELIRGRPVVTRGMGYFRYVVEGEEHRIVGEWGIDDNELGGGPWTGAKSKRMQPHLSTNTGGRSEQSSPVEERGVVGGGNANGGSEGSGDDL